VFIVALSLIISSRSPAQTTVSLSPAAKDADRLLPYRPAELSVRNGTDQVIRGVAVRLHNGGPTFLHFVTVPPGTTHAMTVSLPAVATRQTYSIRLLPDENADGKPLAQHEASIEWDPNVVEQSEAAFFDPRSYRPWESNLPLWPGDLLRNVFLALVLTALALAGTLFIRPARLRVGAILLVAVCAAGALSLVVMREPVVFEQAAPARAASPGAAGLLVVSCRRTVEWAKADWTLAPVYYSPRHMTEDDLLVRWGKEVRARVHPDEVRLFRSR
jgi:hypothetical protein